MSVRQTNSPTFLNVGITPIINGVDNSILFDNNGIIGEITNNITTTQKFLAQTGDGALGLEPEWQILPSAGLSSFFFYNTASDISTYFNARVNASTNASGITQTDSGLASGDTTLTNFATISGSPNITFLPPGITSCYLTARQSAGTKTSQLFAEIYQRTSGGTETLLATTSLSIALTAVDSPYIVQGTIPTGVVFLITDRIVVRVKATVSGVGSAPTIVLTMEDATSSRIELPSTSLSLPVVPANGGTGTSTIFTTGSIIFAGASGVYTTDTVNLFYSDSLNRFAVGGTNTPLAVFTVVGGSSSVPTMSLGGNLNQANFNWSPFPNERQQIFSGAAGSNGYGDMMLASNDTEAAGQTLGYLLWGQKISGKSANNAGIKGAIGMVSVGSGGSTSGFGADMTFLTKEDNSATTFNEWMRLTSIGNLGIDNTAPVGRFQIGTGTAATYTCGTITPNIFSGTIQYDDSGAFPTGGYTHNYAIQAFYDSPLGRVWDTTIYYMSDYGGVVTDDGSSSSSNSVAVDIQYDVTGGSVSGVFIYDSDDYNGFAFDTNIDIGDYSPLPFTTFFDFNDMWGSYTDPNPTVISDPGTRFVVLDSGYVGVHGVETPVYPLEVNGDISSNSYIYATTGGADVRLGEIGGRSGLYAPNSDIGIDSAFGNIAFTFGGGATEIGVFYPGAGTGVFNLTDPYVGNYLTFGTLSSLGDANIGLWSNTGIINIGDGISAAADMYFFDGSATLTAVISSWSDSYVLQNLGVGTNAPVGKLHVIANASQYAGIFQSDQDLTDWAATFASINITNADTTVGNNSLVNFSDAVGGASSAGFGVTYVDRTNHYGDFFFYTKSTDGYKQRITVKANGKIGFGTETPNATLDFGINSTSGAPFWLMYNDDAGINMGIWRDTPSANVSAFVVNSAGLIAFGKSTSAVTPTFGTEFARFDNSGRFGLGLTSLTATVHIKAGTTSASSSPIKLTTGSLMTASEAGAVEFASDDLFFTQTTNTSRHPVAWQDNPISQQVFS